VVIDPLRQKHQLLAAIMVVNTTLISALNSPENADRKRGLQMNQRINRIGRCYSMKAHIGVDAAADLAHSLGSTAANASNPAKTNNLLHGDEADDFTEAGYPGAIKRSNANQDESWYVATQASRHEAQETNSRLAVMNYPRQHVMANPQAKLVHHSV
jgi:transposase, IS5 family